MPLVQFDEHMKRIKMNKTGLDVSEICLGADRFGTVFTCEQAFELLDRFRDAGGNFVDTANIYARDMQAGFSRSEQILGKYLKSRGKDSLIVATKGGHPNPATMHTPRLNRAEIERDLDESLLSLGLDVVDIYYLHRDDPAMPIGEILEILEEMVGKGKIRFYGASNYTRERLEESVKYADEHGLQGFSIVSNMWTPAKENVPLSGDDTLVRFKDSELEFFAKSGIPFAPYSSTAKGWFSKKAAGNVPERLANVFENAENDSLFDRLSSRGKPVQTALLEYICDDELKSGAQIIPITSVTRPEQLDDLLKVHA